MHMMKKYILFISILFVVLSCKNDSSEVLLPKVSGKAGEVLIISPQKYWDNDVGKEIREILGSPQQGLPRDEPMFEVSHLTENKMGRLFKTFRSIVYIKIKHENKEPELLIQRNLWAKNQLILHIVAKDPATCVNFMKERQNQILWILLDAERRRLKDVYKKNRNVDLEKVFAKRDIDMVVPIGYKLSIDTTDMIFIKKEYRDIIQGIAIYFHSGADTSIFNVDSLISRRDKMFKEYPKWEVEEAYMRAEVKYDYPVMYRMKLNDKYEAAELRGLWRTAGGLLRGGPFVSITVIDKPRNRTVTVDGFVFAPEFQQSKRNLIREVYAVISTLSFPE